MGQLIILQGPPCSGKTTWARSEVTGKKDWIIISMDDIRHALGDYWVESREKLVSALESHALEMAMKMKFNIICDGVNLSESRLNQLKKLAKDNDVPVEVKAFYVPFREARRRDGNPDRQHSVGEEALRHFYEKYYPEQLKEELSQPEPPAPVVVAETRILTTADGDLVWTPTQDDLAVIKKLAGLRYPPKAIAHTLKIPSDVFMQHMANPKSPVYQEYNDAKIESEGALRQTVFRSAAAGEEWAIKQIEAWDREAKKEELGL